MNKLVIVLSLLIFVIQIETNKGEVQVVPASAYWADDNKKRVQDKDRSTTFIIIRHAEKDKSGEDPNLSMEGKFRSEELAKMLEEVNISAIYSTPYNRTRQTVMPLASAKGIVVKEYSPGKPYRQLIDEILVENRGKIVVIAGHSNTVPEILKALTNGTFTADITEDQFDNLFIVDLSNNKMAKVIHLKYGTRIQ